MRTRTPATLKCACYTRYSSDLQADRSIEDQIRNCKKLAASKKWYILDEHIYADRAVSGTTIVGRKGLNDLLEAANEKPRPFDYVLVDDTSRLSRDKVEQGIIIRDLKDLGIFVYFVSDGIDTSDDTTEDILLPVYGIKDSLYSKELAKKTQRGMAGQVLKGYNAGGRLYGYAYEQVLDPSGTIDRKTHQVRSLGTKISIDIKQAEVVKRIFSMYSIGHGLTSIAKDLNDGCIEPPRRETQQKRRNAPATWSPHTIREILRNPKYIGDWTWNKKKWIRKRKTGKRICIDRPTEDWVKFVKPELAIITPGLWETVHERISENYARYSNGKRTPKNEYLLSGLLTCGDCGASISIVRGGGIDRMRYGCSFNWKRGKKACTNNVLLSVSELQERAVKAIKDQVLNPVSLNRIVKLVNERLESVAPDLASESDRVIEDVDKLDAQIRNLIQALANATGSSTNIVEAIQRMEAEKAQLESKLESFEKAKPISSLSVDIKSALKWIKDFPDLVRADFRLAKHGLTQMIGELKVTPATENGMNGVMLTGRPQLAGIVGLFGVGSNWNGSGGRI